MKPALRIVIVSADLDPVGIEDEWAARLAERSRSLRIGLLQGGFNLMASLPADAFLPQRLAQLAPDLIIVDAESGARDTLEHVVCASQETQRPIVMFTNDDDPEAARCAVQAGVAAYVVAGLDAARVRSVLEVAQLRFAREQALRGELADARAELAQRKVVERAKGLLMQRHALSEAEAYARLRKAAMNQNLRLVEVAQRLIDLADLLG